MLPTFGNAFVAFSPASRVQPSLAVGTGVNVVNLPQQQASSSNSSTALAGLAAAAVVASAASVRRAKRASGTASGRQVTAITRYGAPVCAGVVITGGAAGVGYAYADEFIRRGHRVVICDVKDCSSAVNAIKSKYPNGSIYGTICDVSDLKSIDAFVEFVKKTIGTVHYWINNAGINGGRKRFTEVSPETVEAVLRVNLGGILLCTHAAMRMMEQQRGVTSHIFNTVGSGVKGGGTPGYVSYGATKRGLPQMTESLVKEIEEGVQGYEKVETPGKVCVHCLSPGMVFTDLLLNESTPELRKFPFGVLAAQPEEVAKDLIPKILSVSGNGKSVEFLTTDKILTKFFEKFILGKKSEYVDDDGNVIKVPGAQYLDNGVRVLYDGMK
jgi:chlorophyll(ide) b reductase